MSEPCKQYYKNKDMRREKYVERIDWKKKIFIIKSV